MTTTHPRLPDAPVDDALPARSHDPVSNRLRRVAGQLTGVQKMYEHGRQAGELLDQLAAARAALDAIGLVIIDQQAERCTRHSTTGDERQAVDELIDTIRRYLRSR